MKGHLKGQVSFTNLIMIFVTCIAYFLLLPLLNDVSENTVTYMTAHSNPYTSLIVSLIYVVPFCILLAIIITTFNYAIPQREGQY